MVEQVVGNGKHAGFSNFVALVGESFEKSVPQLRHILRQLGVLLAEHFREEFGVLAALLELRAFNLVLQLRQRKLEQRRSNDIQLIDDKT